MSKTIEVVAVRISPDSFKVVEDRFYTYSEDTLEALKNWVCLADTYNSVIVRRGFDPKNVDDIKQIYYLRKAEPLIDAILKATKKPLIRKEEKENGEE